MAKAINWPLAFREEVISEDCENLYSAFRLGSLYYENRYWVPDEVVDIRVNHKKIRKAQVVGDLRQCAICELTESDFRQQKTSLRTPEALIRFLAETYNQSVDEQTPVTIVTYRNQPVIPEEIEQQDDPHM
jgi:hypothetical protein